MCFFAGGTRYSEQGFGISELHHFHLYHFPFFYAFKVWKHDRLKNVQFSIQMLTPSPFSLLGAVQIQSSLLILSVVAVLLPAAFHFVAGDQINDAQEGPWILSVSHGVSYSIRMLCITLADRTLILCTVGGHHPPGR